jgi:hypothetical protein
MARIRKSYLTAHPHIMKREIKKNAKKRDDDPSAYTDWDADYKSGKAKKGGRVDTKKSQYTKKYKEMFGESEEPAMSNLVPFEEYDEAVEAAAYEVFLELEADESLEEAAGGVSSKADKALKKKSDKTGFPLGILKQVFRKGMAAWKTGHRPGVTPQQWAFGRVNSFVTGGRTTKTADKELYSRARQNMKKKKKD